MARTRRGRRKNIHYVAPVALLRPLAVPIFRFIPPEPEDEAVTNTHDSDTRLPK